MYEIVWNTPHNLRFAELESGDVFEYQKDLYMKMTPNGIEGTIFNCVKFDGTTIMHWSMHNDASVIERDIRIIVT